MDICKKEKNIDSNAINNVSTAAASLQTESLYIGLDNLTIDDTLRFVNASLNEFVGSKPNTTPAKPETASKTPAEGDKIVTFNVDTEDPEGRNVTKEQLANTGIGIFTKLLLKIGVNNPRAQVALTKIGTMLIGIIVASIITLVVASGGAVAITGTAGWAFTGIGFSIVTVIAGLFFAFGVFLLMCWFRKPYPSLEDYIEYLEAWFNLYPDGKRPENKKGGGQNFKKGSGTPKEGWSKYDENRLKKDDTCRLLSKWNKIVKLAQNGVDVEKNREILDRIITHLKKRGLTAEQFQEERNKCKAKQKEKKNVTPTPTPNPQEQQKGKVVSYWDEQQKKYRTGVEQPKNK
jgi:hypothetical protein